MTFVFALVDLAGHIALLLWGTRMVQTGIQRAFGPSLRSVLIRALGNRLKAFCAGMGVTAVLQSSTATGLMATSFTVTGLVGLVPALAVMLGANVGSTLIVQLLSFNVAAASPALLLVGMLMFRRTSNARAHDLGRVFIGIGLMLLALHQLLDVLNGFAAMPGFDAVLQAISSIPVLSLLLAGALTWAAHSSVAVVLLIMSLASNGLVDPYQACVLALGANLGTAINPLIEGQTGTDISAKRLPVGNLITRIVGIGAAVLVLEPATGLLATLGDDGARLVANFHTAFNVIVALIFLPLLTPFAEALTKAMPQNPDQSDAGKPRYLDPSAKNMPIVALQASAREVLRLVDVLEAMLAGAKAAVNSVDRKALSAIRKQDTVLDRLNLAIKQYLTSLDWQELDLGDKQRIDEILAFSTALEHAGDVLDRNVLPHLAKRLRRGIDFPQSGVDELHALLDRVICNLRAAAALFMSQDERLARSLAQEKLIFREAERKGTRAHFEQLGAADLAAAASSSLHLDLLRDLKQINSHLVAATAYPLLEQRGELLQSRIVARP